MPYTARRVRSRKCYRVINTQTKRVFSKCTSKARAMKQLRLLRAIQNNKNFVPYSRLSKTRRVSEPIKITNKDKSRKNRKSRK
jgi:DNA polymerase IIIc chi subunit